VKTIKGVSVFVGKLAISLGFKQFTIGCIVLSGLAALMLFFSATHADAQSRAQICRSLNAQLASLSRGGGSGGNSAKYRQFDNAARSQQTQITKTKRIAKRGRCTGLGIFNSKSAQCRRIISSLKKMEANLRNLKNSRAKYAPRQAGSTRKRNNILSRMKQNRCSKKNATKQARVKTKPKRKTLLEQVFGVKTYKENGERDTKSNRFDKDQAACQSMCPGTNVELYHHKMPTEDSEEMVSYLTGKAYAKEPFAFAYRKSVDIEQKCRFATENRVQSIETASSENPVKAKSTKIGTPVWREDPALSPDDHDSVKDSMSLKVAKSYLLDARTTNDNPENQLLAENRKVRIVGPEFFPVQ